MPSGTLNWRTDVHPPRDSKPDRNLSACVPAIASRSAGCDSIVTVRCGVNLSDHEIETVNSDRENNSFRLLQTSVRAGFDPVDAPASLPEKLLRLAILLLALLCLAATRVQACGPDFPNNLLDSGDYAVLGAPTVLFSRELERMQLVQTHWRACLATNDHPQESMDAELVDLRAALKKLKTPPEEITRICEAHQVQRERLRRYIEAIEHWRKSGDIPNDSDEHREAPRGEPPQLPQMASVPGLPGEFEDYFAGACEWHRAPREDLKAREAWERLLARPEAERKFKSTWAAYMLGKSWENEEPDKAIDYYQQVRHLVRRGTVDSLGLAIASLGWEARLHLMEARFEKAIPLYLEQLAAGDETAIESLRQSASSALDSATDLVELAKEPHCQKVVTAFLVSSRSDVFYSFTDSHDQANVRWLAAVEAAGVDDVDSAEKFALAAYQSGEFGIAKRWIKRAASTPLTQWLQAKLLLREGKVAPAATLLARIRDSFPLEYGDTNAPVSLTDNLEFEVNDYYREPRGIGAQVLGELGVLQLARSQYADSLDALLHAGFWGDAAYVAERVLTLDELKSYVDQTWPEIARTNSTEQASEISATDRARHDIRYLLGRRLVREIRGVEAAPYFPDDWRPALQNLLLHLNAGWNETQPRDYRAKALFGAACIARTNGIELLGTEVGPDWFIHGGDFEYGVTSEGRTNEGFQLLGASPDELRRAFAHRADPEVRFHYRYQAAFLAWEAAKLMPDNNDETAFVLWQAGEWLKNRDPITADGFYKTLVRRCRQTELGAEADRIHWFPRLDENRKMVRRIPEPEPEPPVELVPEETSNGEPDVIPDPEIIIY
jgi:hypothetical protein